MAITLQDIRKHWWRLKTADEDTVWDVFGATLTQSTKDALLADFQVAVDNVEGEIKQEHRDGIRQFADELDVDDELRIAIEGVE